MTGKCADCGAVTTGPDRCVSCASKYAWSLKPRIPKPLPPPNFCADCDIEIGINAYWCRSCASKAWRQGRKSPKLLCEICGERLKSNGAGLCSVCRKRICDEEKERRKTFCIDCNREITPGSKRCMPCNHKSQEYRDKISVAMMGENNGNWKGGTSLELYGEDWTYALKENVRNRDKRCCQLCGRERHRRERRLPIHHIDYNKLNNSITNLITLCWECHGETSHNCKYWTESLTQKMEEIYVA